MKHLAFHIHILSRPLNLAVVFDRTWRKVSSSETFSWRDLVLMIATLENVGFLAMLCSQL